MYYDVVSLLFYVAWLLLHLYLDSWKSLSVDHSENVFKGTASFVSLCLQESNIVYVCLLFVNVLIRAY